MAIKKILGKESELLGGDTKLYLPFDVSTDDKSGHAHTVTKYGNATTAHQKFGSGCGFFDGDGDYLTIPDSADFQIFEDITETWTVDGWIKLKLHDSGEYIIEHRTDSSNRWVIQHIHGLGINCTLRVGASNVISISGGEITDTNWHHFAVAIVSGGATRDTGVYVDGTQVAYSSATNVLDTTGPLAIGASNAPGSYFDGYMDEIRIQKSNIFSASPNVGLTNTITVPTSEYTIDSNTKLLIHFNGDLTDSSEQNHTVTSSGEPIISYAKIGTNALDLNGSDQYLTVPDHVDWNFGTNDFTIEFFAKFNSLPGASSIINQFNDGTTYWQFYSAGQKLRFLSQTNGNVDIQSGDVLTLGTWHHCAISKESGNYSIYLDGTRVGTGTNATAIENPSTPLYVGCLGDVGSERNYFNGAIDELRISNVARYSGASITIPTSAFTSDVNTKLLLHLDGNLTDSGNTGHTVTAGNSPSYSTHKFGIGSALFDGTADYLSIPDSSDWDLHGSSTDDWTIDFWLNANDYHTTNGNYAITQYEDSANRWCIIVGKTGGIQLYSVGSGLSINMYSDTALTADGNWHHIALVKKGSEYAFYLDGNQDSYLSNSNTDTFSGKLIIGSRDEVPSSQYNGYIDEIRVQHSNAFSASPVVGKTDTITVPTSEHVEDTDTKLLMHFNTDLLDSSNQNHTVSKNGNVGAIPKLGDGCLSLDGDTDFIKVDGSSDWNFMGSSTDNKTIDFFVRFNDLSANQELIVNNDGEGQSGNGYWQLHHSSASGGWRFASWNPQGIPDSSFVGQITDNEWHHMALLKVGSLYALYKDGVQLFYINSTNTVSYDAPLWVGVYGWDQDAGELNGQVDSMRFSNSNIFSASPVVGLTDTITIPTRELIDQVGKFMGISKANIAKISGQSV